MNGLLSLIGLFLTASAASFTFAQDRALLTLAGTDAFESHTPANGAECFIYSK
jgi:hypothetical protein